MRRSAVLTVLLLLLPIALASSPYHGRTVNQPAIQEFSLIDQSGSPFDFSDLSEEIVVVSFIFTTCPDICPVTTQKLVQVQSGLGPGIAGKVAFLSITVDPNRDTPEALMRYMDIHGADWPHLTNATDGGSDLKAVWDAFGIVRSIAAPSKAMRIMGRR